MIIQNDMQCTHTPKSLATFDDQIVAPEIAVESKMHDSPKVDGT